LLLLLLGVAGKVVVGNTREDKEGEGKKSQCRRGAAAKQM
jgi:hypothetical protein